MSCTGNGRCMKECNCFGTICYCLDIAHVHIIDGSTFCKVECKYNCKPIHCLNKQSRRSFPQFKEKTKCNECNIFKIHFTDIEENCFICTKKKYMIETECKHRYCFDCLMNDQAKDNICFICRTPLMFNPY
jgi:hypothetical protein